MSLIRKIKNSKLFSNSSHKNNNKNINQQYDNKNSISSNRQTEYSNSLNIDTTILSDNTSTTLSSPFSNTTNRNNTLLSFKNNSSKFKSPNGTLDTTNRNSIDLKQRNLIVYHIDSETEGNFNLTVRDDELGDYVLNAVCTHYNLIEYKEYFGLKYTLVDDNGDHEIYWLDPLKTIVKQLKDTNNVLTFRVKHFPGKPESIESEYVRYLIFLQIRNYFLKGDLQLSLNDENILASYAIQASLGDYDPELHEHDQNYLQELKFLSRKALKSQEVIVELHKQLKGKTPAEMELAFLQKASQFDTYGAELIVVKNSKGVAINFGVSHNGIITYLHGQASDIPKIGLYPWTQIGKISYEGRSLKVHAHTPDTKNPEVIKKHVMVFKCNNKRICKHLWKFILDQKSFFNFKCGSDVPQIKSSNRLFARKSKFRYSGRCESELIKQQHEPKQPSINNISPISIASTQSLMTDGNNLSRTNTFKRRTFLSVQRVTLAHNNNNNLNENDTNNNLLLTKANNNDSNIEDDGINKNKYENIAETGSQLSQLTVITHNSINNNDSTSTPQLKSKNDQIKNEDVDDDDENIKEELYDSIEPLTARQNKNIRQRNSKINFTLSDETIINKNSESEQIYNDEEEDNEEEQFYDHDECPTQFESILSTSKTSNGSFVKLTNNDNSSIHLIKFKNDNKINNIDSGSSSRFIIFIIIGLVIVLFVILLFYYYKSYTNNTNASLERIVYLKCRKTKNLILNYLTGDNSKNSLISWSSIETTDSSSSTTSSCRNDPLINWFLSQYSSKSD